METGANYAYQIYKKGSFTKAAKELYISQPSLSAAISRLESDLGFRIFDRSTIPCSLTAEGRIYIESLEEILESESNMQKRIKALSGINHGSVAIGGGSLASYLILTELCRAFHKAHPQINVTLDIGNTGSDHQLWEKLDNGELDVLITYGSPHARYRMVPLCEERMVIAMHKDMRGAAELQHLALTREEILTKSYAPEREIEDATIFSNVEFLEFQRKSDVTRRMAKILGSYRTSRYKIENARHSEIHFNLMCAGIGAVLTNTLAIAQKPHDENILFFMPKSEESYRKIFLAHNDHTKNAPIVQKILEVAKDIYAEK